MLLPDRILAYFPAVEELAEGILLLVSILSVKKEDRRDVVKAGNLHSSAQARACYKSVSEC